MMHVNPFAHSACWHKVLYFMIRAKQCWCHRENSKQSVSGCCLSEIPFILNSISWKFLGRCGVHFELIANVSWLAVGNIFWPMVMSICSVKQWKLIVAKTGWNVLEESSQMPQSDSFLWGWFHHYESLKFDFHAKMEKLLRATGC